MKTPRPRDPKDFPPTLWNLKPAAPDFQDSSAALHDEDIARERRRAEAMAEAHRPRKVASDPDASLFMQTRAQAIKARRTENARLQSILPMEDVTLSVLDDRSVNTRAKKKRLKRYLAPLIVSAAVALLIWSLCIAVRAALRYFGAG